jgi:hypothetical protein
MKGDSMPDLVEFEVYSSAEGRWVVRPPGQRSAVLALGGATVYSLFALAQSIAQRASACGCPDAELLAEAAELREELDRLVRLYESVIGAAGLPLPYEPLDGDAAEGRDIA